MTVSNSVIQLPILQWFRYLFISTRFHCHNCQ